MGSGRDMATRLHSIYLEKSHDQVSHKKQDIEFTNIQVFLVNFQEHSVQKKPQNTSTISCLQLKCNFVQIIIRIKKIILVEQTLYCNSSVVHNVM